MKHQMVTSQKYISYTVSVPHNSSIYVLFTFIVSDLVSQYDHAFSEQLVLKVLGEEGAQLSLQQLPTKKHQQHTVRA